mmetsp:Transcript_5708/g.17547  ORF Transcript_5708/g.17547 Transcript_5708/m.17547 type:complete len:80 (-) Transcript_5708:229-468(-)|eukprot:scaffold305951_cov31-Tisochrysis_lutea.AAC.3
MVDRLDVQICKNIIAFAIRQVRDRPQGAGIGFCVCRSSSSESSSPITQMRGKETEMALGAAVAHIRLSVRDVLDAMQEA